MHKKLQEDIDSEWGQFLINTPIHEQKKFLSEREIKITILRLKEQYTFRYIGQIFNVTRDRISVIYKRATIKTRRYLKYRDIPVTINAPIESLNLSSRAYHILKAANINTVESLLSHMPKTMTLRNCGRHSYNEFREILIQHGFMQK